MRRRRKRDIVIELTALLDVIMIMIFMVMNENSNLIKEQQDMLDATQQVNMEQAGEIDDLTAQLAEALGKLEEGNLEELLDRLQAAETMLDGYQAMDEVVTVISVNLENRSNNAIRYLSYGTTIEPHMANCHTDNDLSSEVNELKMFVSGCADKITNDDPDSPIVCVIFSYDPSKVYQRDFEMIDLAIKDIQTSVAEIVNFKYQINPISS